MAVRPGIVLLTKLSLLIYTVKSCAVSCSTDYETLLNCSCSGLEPPETLLLQINCRHDDLRLNVNCTVSKEEPFCVIYPDIMEEIADVETVCSSNALRAQDQTMITTNSSDWKLRNAVKPWPPFNIQVNNTKGTYTISWSTKNPEYCLVFKVRIRTMLGLQKEIILESKESVVHLEQLRLPPGGYYGVDVQAKLCPFFRYQGPWSDWGPTTVWTDQVAGNNHYYWLIPVSFLILLLSVGFPKAMYWQKRFQRSTFIPNPREFFKPLYNIYQGDFKAWVKPAFTEHNSLKMDMVMDVKLEPTPLSLYKSPLGPSSIQSLGQLSISTVCSADPLSHCLLNSNYPHEASSGTTVVDSDPKEMPHLNLSTLNVLQDLDEGLPGSDYPLMDLDTIDSGFEECSSPSAAGHLFYPQQQTTLEPSVEQLCDLYHSNYVKQWRHT
ncbi:hypothetical protein NL108_013015 [Boleophthalmus pectinirostris]|uniref:interleukin-21 receptor-like n=1 Tax=Boleophthalmus pectinirostris TaxID=150288 RepID=UPI00242B3EA3|nr:interleukin-21 receptor-like [Boleophthalmus pectinirostris]KAJ0066425.1 hypothetical protein NL108_013015 [Boleophthalmus pectinirostris]